MVVTLTGTNDLVRRQALDELTAKFVAEYGDIALERFDGEEASYDQLLASVQSVPFLSPRKMVILRAPSKIKNFDESFDDFLKDVDDITDVIFYEPKLDKRTAYYKQLKKLTDFKEFNALDARGLSAWASDYAGEQGGTLGFAEANFLVERAGLNQQMLKSEIDKLLAYSPKITRQTIELLIEPLPQSTVFELLDAAFAGKQARVFELYKEQRALKIEPQAIIAMLAWQFNILAIVKTAGKLSPDEIVKEAKLNPFVVRKTLSVARGLSLSQIKRYISELLDLDMTLKRDRIDADEALQLFLLKLSAK